MITIEFLAYGFVVFVIGFMMGVILMGILTASKDADRVHRRIYESEYLYPYEEEGQAMLDKELEGLGIERERTTGSEQ